MLGNDSKQSLVVKVKIALVVKLNKTSVVMVNNAW